MVPAEIWACLRAPLALLANLSYPDFYTTKNENLFYIKTRSFYIGSDGMPNDNLFVKDKLHLNRKGYKLWGKIIKENFDKNLSL